MQEATIIYCLNLPVVQTAADNHCPNRNGDGVVTLNERSQFCKQARTTALLTATYLLGYNRNLSYRVKLRIARAACTLAAYDYGYKKVPGIYSFDNWLKKIETSVRHETTTRVFQNSHKGKTSLTDQITSEHPTYLEKTGNDHGKCC